jgi:hypothetical protein
MNLLSIGAARAVDAGIMNAGKHEHLFAGFVAKTARFIYFVHRIQKIVGLIIFNILWKGEARMKESAGFVGFGKGLSAGRTLSTVDVQDL